MLRFLKTSVLLGSICLAAQTGWSFSLLGPINEAYQVPALGYNIGGDIGAPKNLAEEYRRNTPVLYYAFDANFVDYFGSNGVWSVEQAFKIMSSLPKASQMSRDLTEWPLSTERENDTARALSLSDLKSATLRLLCEQMGLAEPERYAWTLHTRFIGPGGCPADMAYSVFHLNFDPVPTPLSQFQGSAYVNGTLYSYFINELCPAADQAEAIEFTLDPLDRRFTAVAGGFDPGSVFGGFLPGKYYTGLTRDDIGGIKYLLSTNNMNVEQAGAGTFTYVTNTVPQLLVTSNLMFVGQAALTNSPAAMQGLFPGLIVAASTNYFVNVWVTNSTPYFTNYYTDPFGTPPHIVFSTNRTLVVETRYKHTFDNLYTVQFTNNQWIAVQVPDVTIYTNNQLVTIETVAVTNSPYATIIDPPVTNVTYSSYFTNYYGGEYFILPTNSCDIALLGLQATYFNIWTNFLSASTNAGGGTGTNVNGSTNIQSFTQNLLTYSTNHAFVVLPITCETNSVALRQGIDKVIFQRRNYDSLLGTFFDSTTNYYTLNSVTNSRIVSQRIQRPILVPDILLTAQDLATGPAALPGSALIARSITFSTNAGGAYFGLAGPGTIEPPTGFIYNKIGPIWGVLSPDAYFFDPPAAEASQIPLRIWGSFDGSTNAPVVYPNGTTVESLENQVLVYFTPPALGDGVLNSPQPYSVTFTATGVSPPLAWSLAPGTAGLPPGLTLTSAGLLSGRPTQDGTFDFVVRVTEVSTSRTVDRSYSLTINP